MGKYNTIIPECNSCKFKDICKYQNLPLIIRNWFSHKVGDTAPLSLEVSCSRLKEGQSE